MRAFISSRGCFAARSIQSQFVINTEAPHHLLWVVLRLEFLRELPGKSNPIIVPNSYFNKQKALWILLFVVVTGWSMPKCLLEKVWVNMFQVTWNSLFLAEETFCANRKVGIPVCSRNLENKKYWRRMLERQTLMARGPDNKQFCF